MQATSQDNLVSIIVPIFNELSSVNEVVKQLLVTPLPAGLDREIIIVDDGSTDGTTTLLQELPEDPRVRIHYSVLNFGKGIAVRVGLKYARGQIIMIQDADLEYDPGQIGDLLKPILEGSTEVVFGSRFLGQNRGMQLLQNLGNRILTATINLLYGAKITDAYTCYKIFSRGVAQKLRLQARGFELEAELTAQILLAGYGVTELPIRYQARCFAAGKKIRARDGLKGLLWMAYYRLR